MVSQRHSETVRTSKKNFCKSKKSVSKAWSACSGHATVPSLFFSLWGKLPADTMTALAKHVTHRKGQSFAFSDTPSRVQRGVFAAIVRDTCSDHCWLPFFLSCDRDGHLGGGKYLCQRALRFSIPRHSVHAASLSEPPPVERQTDVTNSIACFFKLHGERSQ